MKRNIDLALLRTLLCVSETGSMSGAAQRLYLTQGAVSQQIKRLEQMLDQRLLERGKDGVRLSEAGLRLVSEGRELIRLHDEMFASFTVRQRCRHRVGRCDCRRLPPARARVNKKPCLFKGIHDVIARYTVWPRAA